MKKIKSFFTCFLLMILSACSGDSDSPTTPEVEVNAPILVSSTPANGATKIAAGDLTIKLTYDQNITSPSDSHKQITIDHGASITSVNAAFKVLTIQISGLERGKTYNLKVAKGVVLGPTKLEAAQYTITFSTMEEVSLSNKLVTQNPMAQTQEVFNYLVESYGNKVLSCAIANVNWNTNEADLVYKATGKYPAINCFDYIHLPYSPANWIDYSNTKVAEDWWNAGGLIAAGWHWNVPLNETNTQEHTCTPSETTFRAKNIFVEGSWEKKVADADLEKMANMLLLLQDKGIPVIWRPLHEAAGNIYEYNGGTAWFWWGYDGAEVYVKLWRYMFDYFKEKGINNLIWVWTTQEKDSDFYPGDEYVDIIGRDLYGADYNNEKDATQNASHFKSVQDVYPHKLVTLSECGSVGKISEQWNAGARWSWFMPWYQHNASTLVGHEHADENWWKDAMSQDYVVSRDQLPSFK